MKLVISACLLGEPTRYDGGTKPCPTVCALASDFEIVPLCPEKAAGLPVPRPPAEQREGRVFLSDGTDVADAFSRGSALSCAEALASGAVLAVLKSKSPSCGAGAIYDGTYTGTLVPGWGIFAALLRDAGITVVTELDVALAQPSAEKPWALLVEGDGRHLAELLSDAPIVVIPRVSAQGFEASCAQAHARGCGVWIADVAGCPRASSPFISALMRGLADDGRSASVGMEDLSGYSTVALVRKVLRLL